MKEGWSYKKLGEVARVQNGFAFDSKLFNDNAIGTPLIRIRDIKRAYSTTYTTESCSSDYFIEDGHVLIGMDGDFNICVWAGGHAYLNQRVCHVVPTDVISPRFIYYFLPFPLKKINDKTSFSTVKHLSSKQVNEILIPVPPLSEQRSIVTRLDAAFSHMDALKANAEKQLNEARKLFQAELTECMKPKEGWVEKRLGAICKVINGRAYSKNEMLKSGKYRLLRVGNFFTNDSWYYSNLELEDDKYCDNGDLLYAWSASFGPRIWNGEKVIYHYHIWKMVSSPIIDKYFLYYWLDSDELKKQTMTNLHGTTMAHITKGIIEAANVNYPSIDIQHSIVSRLDSLSSNIRKLEELQQKTIAECDALKQAMLKEVFE